MTWNPISEPQDFVILGGQRTPGIAKLEGFSSPRKWDERKGPGLSGATLRFHGIGLAKGTLKIFLESEADWDDWHEFAPTVQRPPVGDRARHLQIEHPMLEMLGIRAVAVEDVSQPMPVDDTGYYSIEIKLIEHRAPRPALSTPTGSADEATTDPNADLRARIRERTEVLHRELAR